MLALGIATPRPATAQLDLDSDTKPAPERKTFNQQMREARTFFDDVDPRYLFEYLKAIKDPLVREYAASALVKLGPPAVPGLIEALGDQEKDTIIAAAKALGRMGPAAKDAIGPLMKAMQSKDQAIVAEAASAMARIGEPALPAMLAELKNSNPEVRLAAARGIAAFGPAAEKALPELLAAMRANPNDKSLRFWIVAELGDLGPAAAPAVPALIALWPSLNPQDRAHVARTFGEIGPEARAGVPLLMAMLSETKGIYNTDTAAEALVGIGGDAAPALIAALRDSKNNKLRDYAMVALARIGVDAVEPLIVELDNPDENYREQVAYILSLVGEPAIEELIAATRDAKQPKQFIIARILARIPSAAPMALQGLVVGLQQKDFKTRIAAAQSLGGMGPAAKEAVPHLMEGLLIDHLLEQAKDEKQKESYQVYIDTIAAALVAIGEEAVPYLGAGFQHPSETLRNTSALVLENIAITHKEAVVPALVASLMSKDKSLREKAQKSLAEIRPRPLVLARLGKRAFPGLLMAMRGSDERLRQSAALAMAMHREDGLPELVLLLGDKDIHVRTAAAMAIGAMGPSAENAAPHLLMSLDISKLMTANPVTAQEVWDHHYTTVAQAIGRIGRGAVPVLTKALKLKVAKVRETACRALGEMGHRGGDGVPGLILALGDPEIDVRRAAVAAISRISVAAHAAARDLLDAMRNRDAVFAGAELDEQWAIYRNECGAALARLGEEAVPELIPGLYDKDPKIRLFAAKAILNIRPKKTLFGELSEDPLADLLPLLKDDELLIRVAAIDVIGLLGPSAVSAVPDLLAVAKRPPDPNEIGRHEEFRGTQLSHVSDALTKVGETAVEELIEATKDENDNVRTVAVWSLKKLAPESGQLLQLGSESIPVLIEALKDYDSRYGKEAADTLVMIGNDAVRPLLEASKRSETSLRSGVERTLARMYEDSAHLLVDALDDEDPAIRSAAARALGGPEPTTGIPVSGVVDKLLEALKDKDEMVRYNAGRSLRWIYKTAPDDAGVPDPTPKKKRPGRSAEDEPGSTDGDSATPDSKTPAAAPDEAPAKSATGESP